MKEDNDRVFDVSKPHRVSPSATSKPVIVGHHPMAVDPMVREQALASTESAYEHRSIPVFEAGEHRPMIEEEENRDDGDNLVSPVVPAIVPEHPESVVAAKAPLDGEPDEPQPTEATEFTPAVAAEDVHHTLHSSLLQDEGESDGTANVVSEHPQTYQPEHQQKPRRRRRIWLKLLIILILLFVAGYLAIDSRLIKTNIKLPYHFFKQPAPAATVYTPPVQKAATQTALAVPTGFVNYVVPATTISFDYPTVWGTPTTTTEAGYTSRSASASTDGTYAYITNFASNAGIQIVLTSSKYLPPVRSPLYYDYLQWCVGTDDGQIYKSTLQFTTASGVDTPSTVVCNQGPLTDAVKLNSATIYETKTTNPDGSALGDLYTENLNDTSLPVLRVKDTTSSNSTDIRQLLSTVAISSSSN